MKNKVGKIKVALHFLREDELRAIFFKHFIPVKTDIEYFTDNITFTGESHLFDEIKEGDVIPFYDFTFSRHESGYILEKATRL
jgi:hypothetical protein